MSTLEPQLQNDPIQHGYFHNIFQAAKGITTNLYTKTGLSFQLLENNAKKLDNFSSPYIEKLTSVLDNTVDTTINKTNNVKQNIISLKDDVLEKTVNMSIVQKPVTWSVSVLESLENQVQALRESYNDEPILNENNDQQKIEENRQEIQENGQSYQQQAQITIYNRGRRLIFDMNDLGRLFVQKQLKNLKLKRQQIGELIFRQQLFNKMNGNIKEIRASSEAVCEVVYDYLLADLVNKYVIPSGQFINVRVRQGKDYVLLTVENVKQIDCQKIRSGMMEQLNVLKEGSVRVYNDYVNIQFAKEFYLKNQQKIQNEVNQVVLKIQEAKKSVQDNSYNLYRKAVEEYQQKKNQRLLKLSDDVNCEEQQVEEEDNNSKIIAAKKLANQENNQENNNENKQSENEEEN